MVFNKMEKNLPVKCIGLVQSNYGLPTKSETFLVLCIISFSLTSALSFDFSVFVSEYHHIWIVDSSNIFEISRPKVKGQCHKVTRNVTF